MKPPTNAEILSGLRSGKDIEKNRALKQLYAAHYPTIIKFINRNNGSKDDAADIFQDAVIVLYEKIRLGQLELNCSLKTYIYSICRNLWLNRLRAKKRISAIDDEIMTIPISAESLSVLIENEKDELIMKLIETLGTDCKKVLRLYYFDRRRMKDIAAQMGLANDQVAKNKKSGCMKKLKALILESPTLIDLLK